MKKIIEISEYLEPFEKKEIINNMFQLGITKNDIIKDINVSISYLNMVFRGARSLTPYLKEYLIQNKLLREETNKMKIKLKDLTEEQYKKWQNENCYNPNTNCEKCIFYNVSCDSYLNSCWINHKELYSETFLNQEVEFEEPFLTDEERDYLSVVIKPFRNSVVWIKKQDYYPDGQYIKIEIKKDVPVVFPLFEENKYYKGMEVDKKYTLEELGL